MSVGLMTRDKHVTSTLELLEDLLVDCRVRDFAVRLWDATLWRPDGAADPRFTLVLNSPEALRNTFLNISDLTLGEAYIFDDFDIEGDIEAVYEVAEQLADRALRLSDKARLGRLLLKPPSGRRSSGGRSAAELRGDTHTPERDRRAVTYHYDVGNDFYSLWLDKNMVYSCAYFAAPYDDLDSAQESKLDYICRKLRLKPGDRLLDIGCGWGGLVRHAAKYYGARALGITLSEPQAELANRRIRDDGLAEICRVEVRDYRNIDEPCFYDKLVSVGMFEHVGEAMLPAYFEQASRLLKPGGVFLNHGISKRYAEPSGRKTSGPSFVEKYVFPGGELVRLSTSLREAEQAGFEVRDVESLREHYMWTLRNWVRRLQERHDEVVRATDETTYRIWRMFMSASAYGFRTGRINVYQTLLVKPDKGMSGLPLRRSDWYS